MTEMSRDLDMLNKAKARLEREKTDVKSAIAELKAEIEVKDRLRVNSERLAKDLEKQLSEFSGRFNQANEQIQELNSSKARLGNDVAGLRTQCEELESEVTNLGQVRVDLTRQLDDAR